MMPRPATDSLKSLGTVFAPIAIVLLTAAIFTACGQSDVRAAAQPEERVLPRTVVPVPVTTEAALAAKERVRSLRSSPFGADPLLHDGTPSSTAIAARSPS